MRREAPLDILHLAAPCRNVPVTFTLDGRASMVWHTSFNALYSDHDGEPWLKVRPNGNLSFQARVTYRTDAHDVQSFETMVRITRNGYDDGAITLDDVPDLTPTLRAQFLPIPPGTCDYSSAEPSLTIRGTKEELGDYEVRIAPAV